MTQLQNDRRMWFQKALYSAVEYGIYLYSFAMLFDKGEGLRNMGLYGALFAWVILAAFYKKIRWTWDLITIGFIIYVSAIVFTTFFSIDPLYSLHAMKKDILKAILVFLIVSTSFEERMIFNTGKTFCFVGFILLVFGLHGYFSGRTVYVTSENMFLSAHKNRYALFMGYLLPFFFLLVFRSNVLWKRVFWGTSSLAVIMAVLFSASRGGLVNIFSVIIVWMVSFFKKKYIKRIGLIVLVLIVVVSVSLTFMPDKIKRYLFSYKYIGSLTLRTELWKPAINAVKKRPLIGWGYGGKILRDPKPYEGHSGLPEWFKAGGLHNTFISILFHHGVIGLVSYIQLLLLSIMVLISIIKDGTSDRKLIAVTLLSCIVGSYVVHSIVKLAAMRYLSVIIGMSSALVKRQNYD